jgi:uncharacterized membrane protein
MKSEITPTTSSETNPTARLEAFSDGVFSIAITLLVFNIAVPRELDPDQPLFAALLTLAPSYFAFFLSFLTIGIMWINHHNLFKVIHRTDHVLLVMNLLLLLMITFVNFPTAVLGAYIGDPANQLTASLLYGGTFVITAVVFNLLWRYAYGAGRHAAVCFWSAAVSGRYAVELHQRLSQSCRASCPRAVLRHPQPKQSVQW